MKSRQVARAGQVAGKADVRSVSENLALGLIWMEDLRLYDSIILKWTLKK